jgi:hypothetical protein
VNLAIRTHVAKPTLSRGAEEPAAKDRSN